MADRLDARDQEVFRLLAEAQALYASYVEASAELRLDVEDESELHGLAPLHWDLPLGLTMKSI